MSPISSAAEMPKAPRHLCIYHMLADWARHTPDAPAILAPGRTPLTYGRLHKHVDDVVQTLHAMGLGRHDRVALVLPNGPEMAVAFLAVATGATCVPLNPTSSANEFDLYLTNLDATALVMQGGTDTPARAVAQARGLQIIELSPVREAEAGLFTLAGEGSTRSVSHEFAVSSDVALMVYTAGTTSQPKIVPLTHANICTAAHNMRAALELDKSDRCLNVLPFFHVHALLTTLLTSLVAGASVVCNPGFSAPTFFASMAEFHPTWYTAVPTVHQAILASAARHREIIARCPLRFIRSGSAALPPQVLAELEKVFQAPVIVIYGITEAAGNVTYNPLPSRAQKIGSVGEAAGLEVAIMDEEGTLLPAGEIGEVVVRGPSVFQGYYNNPTANSNAFTRGWFRTGDQGFLDRDSYLFITGRLKEIINRGGEMIAPQEVDNVLMEHPAVAQAVTFAVPHPRLGEEIAAAVALHQNATATEQDIRRFAARRLADSKVPRQVYIVEELPRTPTGKLQRIGLAEKFGLRESSPGQPATRGGYIAPRTPMEEALSGLWAQVFGLDRVGIHDDFFQLGGDSILAMQLISRVRETWHIELSFSSLFETPTVAGIARSIEITCHTAAQQRLEFSAQLDPGSHDVGNTMSRVSSVPQKFNAPQHLCISHLLQEHATRTPEALAILAPGRPPLTYGRLHRHVDEVVQTLHAMGLGRHDRVAVVLPNGPEMAVACLAVAAGMTCAPLNPAYSANEFAFYLTALRPQTLLIQQGMDSPARAVAQAHNIRVIELLCTPEAAAGLFTLINEECTPAVPLGFAAPGDVAFVLHTSGTTSRPKIVPLTHTNVCVAADNVCTALALSPSDRCLNILPLFHTYGLVCALLTSLTAGASTVCLPGFDASRFFAWLEEFRPTWYQAVPAMHQAILTRAAQHRESIARCPLRFIRTGTAPLPPSVRAELESEFKIPLIEGWGAVEACGPVTCNAPLFHQQKAGSVGVSIGPEVAIMDEIGTVLPAGAIGEVVVRGPTVMPGYENDPTDNRRAFTHGWFRSGDVGYLDADGYLYLTGRIKEIINRGGEKIAPQEVDDVLMSHPAVAQAATFAVPHARLGEDIAAAVVLHSNAMATASDIRQFATTRLAAFKVPSQVLIVDDIPKGPTGKLQRLGLAEQLGLTAPDRVRPAMPGGTAAPRTPVEEVLAGLWGQVLGLDGVGIHDNFSALGGDSILATQLISRVREVMHVEVSFRSFFETPSVAGMAGSIEVPNQTTPALHGPPLQPVPRDGPLPLSYAQQRLWFLEQLEPSRAVYNVPLAWRCSGDLNVPALEKSLHEMVQRHDILRTTFPSVDGQPVQVIAPDLALPLPVVDLSAFPETEREALVQRLATEEAQRPFDLAHGPLVRATLLRLSDEDHVLLLTLHHIIFDGWSAEIFWRELATLYTAICTGQPISFPALPLQYADFAVWQRQWLQGEVLEAQLAYWKQQLGDTLPVLELPTDRPRPPIQTFQGARQSLLLLASLTAALKALSQREGVTLFMTLVAAFQALLCRYTGQTDLVVGTPLAGRTRVETEGLLGFFVNTLALRTDLSGNPRFRELLGRVRTVTLGAYDHQDLPFEKLVEVLQPARDLSRNPLVQAMVALQPSPPPVTELLRLTVRPVTVDCGTAKFELTLSLQDTAQGLLATVEYSTDLFDPSTIARMLGHFHTLLEGIVTDPEQCLADLPLLTAAEKQQLLVEWNTTTADYPQDTCLHALFEAQVERMPNTVAVVCNDQQLTYDALNRRANQLAHDLRALGVGPEVCVGLCMERSLEMAVGLLGILKAGGAYVPLDPAYPPERLALMVADARLAVLVTQQQCLAALPTHGAQAVCLDTDGERLAQQSESNPASGVTPKNLAYVMYTSGSTGIPKGVMVEHRQVTAFLHGFEHVAPGGEGGIGTAVCPFGFDVSVWECFSMLCFGGTLHIILPETLTAPEQFARYLVDHRITSAYIPPALLADVASHLEQQHEETALKRLLVGVEPIKQGTLQRFRTLSEQIRIVNGYGPTETTVCATLFPFHSATEPDRRTPIGTRVDGYEVYLVDAHLQPVPMGLPGELLIGGAGLARGYINHPERTAEMFISHPFSTVPEARLYKTGDLARYLPDGNLEFLGRRDQQVKIRGYRIELEEIEAVLRQHPAVQETVVLAQEDARRGDKRLVAYVVANQEPALAPRAWRSFLQQKLPEYMIPSAFVVLEALPRTANGKLDRQALPMPDATSSPGAAAAPRTPGEDTLAGIWADVLGLERVGMHDNFFELGGDSILSMQIIARANRAGLRLTPRHLFQHQTIAALSAVAGTTPAIQAEQGPVVGPVPLTPIQHWFFEQELSDLHHWNQAMLIEVRQTLDFSVLECAVQHLLVHHDMLRARFKRETDGWQQDITPPEASALCVRIDLSALSEAQQGMEMAAVAAQLQASLHLVQGPLVRLALFECGPHKSARLLVVIHHLVVDSVSWRILLEDLQMACEQLSVGKAIQLPPKTTSFKHWAERLTAYAQSAELQQERTYWLATPRAQVGRLSVDYPGGANTVASACTVSVSLSTKETETLLQEVPRAYQTQINDVLLTALAQAFARWTGKHTLLLDLEGHGREEVVESVDLSRTVGWFTTLFPVLLQFEHATTPVAALKTVKEQLRRIPQRGIGYGVWCYLSQDTEVAEKLRVLPQAEVRFNYLGRVDQGVAGTEFFGPALEASGLHRSPRGRRRYLLEVNGRLAGGHLQCDWTYSERVHRRDTIERLALGFIEALRTLIVHCQSPEAGGYTPSDFPKMQLSQQELDELLMVLGESAEGD